MKKIIMLFVFVMALSAVSFCAASSDDMFSYIPYKSASWKSQVTMEGNDGTNTFDQVISFKGKKMRMEGKLKDKSSGETVNQVIIMDSKAIYIINSDKKSAMKMSLKNNMNPEKYSQEAAKYRKKAKMIGTQTIGGVACEIFVYDYEMEGNDKPIKMKEWRAADGFIMKSTSEMENMKTTSVVSDLKKNPSLSDSLFVPEKDITIMDMDNLMKGAFKAADEEEKAEKAAEKTLNKKEKAEEEATPVDAGEAVKKALQDEGADAAKDALKGLFGQ